MRDDRGQAQRDLPYEMLKLEAIEEKVGDRLDLPARAGNEGAAKDELALRASLERRSHKHRRHDRGGRRRLSRTR
jgi:hypothetical protein